MSDFILGCLFGSSVATAFWILLGLKKMDQKP
jgi:hypothetical protein